MPWSPRNPGSPVSPWGPNVYIKIYLFCGSDGSGIKILQGHQIIMELGAGFIIPYVVFFMLSLSSVFQDFWFFFSTDYFK